VKFETETGGRRRTIEVRPSGTGWIVTVNGRAMEASLVRAGSRWSLLIGEGDPAARSYEVSVESRRRGEHAVGVNGRAVPVSMLDPWRRAPPGRVSGAAHTVVAPMPGRVVKVLVARGDVVTARQGLVVVEAMKMENELRAPGPGTVTEVRAREGEPVEANAVLVVIEP
jgi:biotin carboxyl carrier protein